MLNNKNIMEPNDGICELFNNNDKSISYKNSAGLIKPQFLYELILFSFAGMIDNSVPPESSTNNKKILSDSLKQADMLHHDPKTLSKLLSEFSDLHERAKSNHFDIFRDNPTLLAALSFIEFTLCSKDPRSTAYNKDTFFDQGHYICDKHVSITDQQPGMSDIEARANLDELAANEIEPEPSICKDFLLTLLSCACKIALPFRIRPSTRIAPVTEFDNPALRTGERADQVRQ